MPVRGAKKSELRDHSVNGKGVPFCGDAEVFGDNKYSLPFWRDSGRVSSNPRSTENTGKEKEICATSPIASINLTCMTRSSSIQNVLNCQNKSTICVFVNILGWFTLLCLNLHPREVLSLSMMSRKEIAICLQFQFRDRKNSKNGRKTYAERKLWTAVPSWLEE